MARIFQEAHGLPRHGFVIFYQDCGVGWTASVRRASGWLAGCRAVPVDGGPIFVAAGGDYEHGANHWEKMVFIHE